METDNPGDILRDVSKFEPWLKYEVHPVVDVAEFAALGTEAVESRRSVAKLPAMLSGGSAGMSELTVGGARGRSAPPKLMD